MPGQDKLVMDYYQKNPEATASLRGNIYEQKIIDFIKSGINLFFFQSPPPTTFPARNVIIFFYKFLYFFE